MKYQYDYDGSGEDGPLFEVTCSWDDLASIAEAAAEDYFNARDGWEADWPVEFVIYDEDGQRLGSGEVHLEHLPHFRAGEMTAQPKQASSDD